MKRFHAHLDVCRQCREHPFALCKSGEALLRLVALDDGIAAIAKAYGIPGPPSSAPTEPKP